MDLLAVALRTASGTGAHAPVAQQVVLTILFARLLAEAGHDGPPHAHHRPPRTQSARRHRHPHHGSLTGRRPRG